MGNKTKAQLEAEMLLIDNNTKEREISDKSYAPMIVKSIVFGAVSIILVSVIGALIGLVVLK